MFKKPDINGAALRILTLACYFLPFVFYFSTCVDGIGRTAYNKADAIQNEKDKVIAEKKDLIEAAANLVADKLTVSDSAIETSSETIKLLQNADDAWLLNPTVTSASAIGFIFMFEELFPKVVVFLSMLLSLVTFLMWRWLKRRGFSLYFMSGNLLLVISFLIYCFACNVTALYGVYVLIFLLGVQLLTELQNRRETDRALHSINPN